MYIYVYVYVHIYIYLYTYIYCLSSSLSFCFPLSTYITLILSFHSLLRVHSHSPSLSPSPSPSPSPSASPFLSSVLAHSLSHHLSRRCRSNWKWRKENLRTWRRTLRISKLKWRVPIRLLLPTRRRSKRCVFEYCVYVTCRYMYEYAHRYASHQGSRGCNEERQQECCCEHDVARKGACSNIV